MTGIIYPMFKYMNDINNKDNLSFIEGTEVFLLETVHILLLLFLILFYGGCMILHILFKFTKDIFI